jgi:hypothetical protein
MALLQPSGNTQRLAHRVADALARGRSPSPMPALDTFLAGPIEEIYAVLEAFERHIATGTERTDVLAGAYLWLMQMRLERLRYDIDADYDWAKEAARHFQETVAEHVLDGRLGREGFVAVGRALREAKLAPTPALIEAGLDQLGEVRENPAGDLSFAANRTLRSLAEQAGNDPFEVCDAMAEGAFTLPHEARAAAATFLLQEGGALGEVAALMILDPGAEVRRSIALALAAQAGRLAPASLRRLIQLRNWLPETEHHLVDQVVRGAREAGVECAPGEAARAVEVSASAVDGAGVQGFLITSPAGKGRCVSSVLVKRAKGIQQAWCRRDLGKGELRRMMRHVASQSVLDRVERGYLDLTVSHYLAVGRRIGNVPPPGLLQVAEEIGGEAWRPAELDWRSALARLLADVPPPQRSQEAIQRTLSESSVWTDERLADSWFEEDQEAALLAKRARTRDPERLAQYLLRTLMVQRAEKWAEHFVWMALRHRHALLGAAPVWIKYAILAEAIAAGRPLHGIPLMRDIAERSALALLLAA